MRSSWVESPVYAGRSMPNEKVACVVSISDNGKMNNLNDTLIWYEDKSKKYYMRLGEIQEGDIDEYRDLIKSNYNTFQSKLKGNLGIVA